MSEKINSGAQAIQIFDSHAGELHYNEYLEFSLFYTSQLAKELKKRHPETPIIFFVKGQYSALNEIFQCEFFNCISIDYQANLENIKEIAKKNNNKIIQGNLDPGVLFGNKETIEGKTKNMIDIMNCDNYIVNLGHGLWPEHSPDNVKIFVDFVHEYSKNLIGKKL